MVTASFKVDAEAKVSMPIRFRLDSSDKLADQASQQQLDELVKALQNPLPGQRFLIEGHTCVKGEVEHNNRLSIARANFVVGYLKDRGVPLSALEATGCGQAEAAKKQLQPTADESTLAPYRKVMLFRIFTPSQPSS